MLFVPLLTWQRKAVICAAPLQLWQRPCAAHYVLSLGVQIPTINQSWWSSSGFLHQQERFSMRTAWKSPINSERRQEAFTKNEIASTSYSNTNILQSAYMHKVYHWLLPISYRSQHFHISHWPSNWKWPILEFSIPTGLGQILSPLPLSTDVIGQIPSTHPMWHIFFHCITSTSTWTNSGILKVESVHSSKT